MPATCGDFTPDSHIAERVGAPLHLADQLVLVPDDIDLSQSPVARHLTAETYARGAFNPGLMRLAGGDRKEIVGVFAPIGQCWIATTRVKSSAS